MENRLQGSGGKNETGFPGIKISGIKKSLE
jgi:hypothetical protein